MSRRARSIVPNYPVFHQQRVEGCLPPAPINTPDLRPWGLNPAYTQYAGARGRNLSGLAGIDMQNAEPIKDYPNELDILQAADDVQGNGLFDPAGSHGNIHPDEGIFADNQDIPGYMARDKFYTPSEVRDATTGQPVMYAPGGAVAVDDAQRQAFLNRNLWTIPPGVNPWPAVQPPMQSTVIPRQGSWPIGQDEPAGASVGKMFAICAVAGLSVGMLLALVIPKPKRG